jgi:hypothetical protein|nr:MAG TPA_asm: hypothetical protein [Caudoviricetes sp.]
MANLYDFTFQLTGVKKQKACEEIIKNLKLKKCYVQYQEKELVIKFEESKCEIYKASQIAKKYNCKFNYIAEEPGMDIYWTNNCYYPTYKLEGNMISQIIYFESEGEVLDYLICNFSFNESITRKIKNLEKYLWDEQSESKYKHEPNIEEIIKEIQKSHKEDDFYLLIHKFDYVEPEDTEA